MKVKLTEKGIGEMDRNMVKGMRKAVTGAALVVIGGVLAFVVFAVFLGVSATTAFGVPAGGGVCGVVSQPYATQDLHDSPFGIGTLELPENSILASITTVVVNDFDPPARNGEAYGSPFRNAFIAFNGRPVMGVEREGQGSFESPAYVFTVPVKSSTFPVTVTLVGDEDGRFSSQVTSTLRCTTYTEIGASERTESDGFGSGVQTGVAPGFQMGAEEEHSEDTDVPLWFWWAMVIVGSGVWCFILVGLSAKPRYV